MVIDKLDVFKILAIALWKTLPKTMAKNLYFGLLSIAHESEAAK